MATISGDFSTNLVAHWEFEDNVLDSTAADKDLTAANSPSYITGKIGSKAISFNGTNQYVYRGSFNYSRPFTINLWVRETTQTGDGSNPGLDNLVFYSSVDYCEASLSGGSLYFAGVGNAWVDTGIDVSLNTWTMLTFVAQSSGGMDVYKNGTKVYDGADNLDPLTGTIYFATWKNVSGWAAIDLDAISVWSSALSSTDVTTLYNSGSGIPYAATASGPASLKTRDTIAKASVKTIDGIAIASVKSINTIT